MQINVAHLLKQPIGACHSYEIDATIRLNAEKEATPIQGGVELIHTDRGILARGTLEGKVNLLCSRCLALFDYPLKFEIAEEFLPRIEMTSGVFLPPSEDSTAFPIDERHTIDLTEAIRQRALLALPMKPLCHPECAGLCPQCGANLNEGTCQCVTRPLESP